MDDDIKFCKDCAHSRDLGFAGLWKCYRPLQPSDKERRPDLVRGYVTEIQKFDFCDNERTDGPCGESAQFFEAKATQPVSAALSGWLWKIADALGLA